MSGADDKAATLSLGEAEALIAKAARGAGLPWGLAQEAGRAARRAFAAGRSETPETFLAWLKGDPGGADCPLKQGLFEAETGGASDDASLIRAAAADRAPSLGVLRAEISGPTLKGLERLAHHTYAPATEESRARGAG